MKNIKKEIKRKIYQQLMEYLKLCLTHKLGKVEETEDKLICYVSALICHGSSVLLSGSKFLDRFSLPGPTEYGSAVYGSADFEPADCGLPDCGLPDYGSSDSGLLHQGKHSIFVLFCLFQIVVPVRLDPEYECIRNRCDILEILINRVI